MRVIRAWFDNAVIPSQENENQDSPARKIDWRRAPPFLALHVGCLAVLWVGWSTTALVTAALLYVLRMIAITGFYHRYFSHRSFKTGRGMQFALAVLGASAAQRGPLWWASQHRHHHAHADAEQDAHSPSRHGFLWSHMGWFLSRTNFYTREEFVTDLRKYPELRFLDRFDMLIPMILIGILYGAGELLREFAPQLHTDGAQLVVWGFFISTVALYHATFTVNSLAHRFGSRRYATGDTSRNNLWLALLTFGEGWHNNHHRYPGSARQGLYWWELDATYLVLRVLAACGLIWDLRCAPVDKSRPAQGSGMP